MGARIAAFLDWLSERFQLVDRWVNGSHWTTATWQDVKASSFYRVLLFVFRDRRRVEALLHLVLPQGHAMVGLWLGFVLVVVLVYGPTLDSRGWADALALVFGVALLGANYWLAHVRRAAFDGERYLFALQVGFVGVTALTVIALASPSAKESDLALYLHIVLIVTLQMLLTLVVCRWLSRRLFGRFSYGADLANVELFVQPAPRNDRLTDFLRGGFVVPFHRPLELVLPAGLWILLQADETLMFWGALALLLSSWLLLAAAQVRPRLRAASDTFGRWFFDGFAIAVTLLVLALAALRLADVHYVTTLIEVAPAPTAIPFVWFSALVPGLNPTVLTYVVVTYALVWFFSYWTNRFVSEELLAVFARSQSPRDSTGQIRYPFNPAITDPAVDVCPLDRKLQIHGSSRFAAIGKRRCKPPECQATCPFHTDDDSVAASQNVGHEFGPASDRRREEHFVFYDVAGLIHAVLNPTADRASKRAYRADLLRQRVTFYNVICNVLLVAFICGVFWLSSMAPQAPELVTRDASAGHVDIADLLYGEHNGCGLPWESALAPRIVVAGSGGGTRAAVHTAAVLRGLAQAGFSCNVVLVSGVSGSSAAFAYYASHAELRRAYDSKVWDRFLDTMAAPFIQDALDGLSEWRIAGLVPASGLTASDDAREFSWMGFRAGHLLAESFERRFHMPPDRRTLGNISNLGVIFNTAIAGQFPPIEKVSGVTANWKTNLRERCAAQPDSLPHWEAGCGAYASARGAGGRLLLTNLTDSSLPTAGGPLAADDEYLIHTILRNPSVPLARAAALSANFPPVFSNAAIDTYAPITGPNVRTWVTDGGAVDNRGLLPIIYAMREGQSRAPDGPRPPLHIVVAEGSAATLRFSQDRGVGAGLSSKEKLASQLITELLCSLSRGPDGRIVEGRVDGAARCEGDKKTTTPDVFIHYLTMPTLFRDGGFGTHWMTPSSLTFTRPVTVPAPVPKIDEPDELRLTGCQTRLLVEELYGPSTLPADSEAATPTRGCKPVPTQDLRFIRRWIHADDYRNSCDQWTRLADSLGFEPNCRN